MTEYLLKVQNTYRVSTEAEAIQLKEKLRNESGGNLTAFQYAVKYIKQKGEIVGEYWVCKATIEFNPEKECERHIDVTYEDV